MCQLWTAITFSGSGASSWLLTVSQELDLLMEQPTLFRANLEAAATQNLLKMVQEGCKVFRKHNYIVQVYKSRFSELITLTLLH